MTEGRVAIRERMTEAWREGNLIGLATEEIDALQRRMAEAEHVLRAVEWAGEYEWGTNPDEMARCPFCLEPRANGHQADCRLARLLSGGVNHERP
jgi:hypothetical protein